MFSIKALFTLIVLVALGGGVYVTQTTNKEESTNTVASESSQQQVVEETALSATSSSTTTSPTTPTAAAITLKLGTYKLISAESVIAWEASKPLIADYTHKGTIGVSTGSLTLGSTSSSGTFTIDMNAIKVTSLGGGKAGRESALESHLKGTNFFDSTKFPTGAFVIESITPTQTANTFTVKGKLTLKGVSNPIEFPVLITQAANGKVVAEGPVNIDRTKWGITYGSGSFFDNLANNAIDDTIKLKLKLVAQ